MKPTLSALLLSPLLLLAVGAPAARGDGPATKAPPYAPIQDLLQQVRMGEGIPTPEVILFPLYLEKGPAPLGILPTLRSGKFSFEEPRHPKQTDDLLVHNGAGKPLLLLGGTVIEGGLRDRLVLHDHIVPPGETLEIRTLPASTVAGVRREPADFRTTEMLAPPYLRLHGVVDGGRNLVPTFVLHMLDFRNPNDTRESLAAIGESESLAEYCLSCHRSISEWPRKTDLGVVIGGIAVVRGRVQSAEMFGGNDLLTAYFQPILKSLSFPAAVIEIRAKKASIDVPGAGDEAKALVHATDEARDLLARIQRASYSKDTTPTGDAALAFILRLSDGTRGRAVMHSGRFVHLAVFPEDPFERLLWSGSISPAGPDVDPLDTTNKPGAAELKRRAALGERLTEAEKRFLQRAP